jgi:hypothetical protein
MRIKNKKDQNDFQWTRLELKASGKINSLPKSLQIKLASRKPINPTTAKP